MTRRMVLLGLVVLLPLGLVGCSDDGQTLDVVLSEWLVDPDDDSIESGEYTVTADNQGGEVHELVVIEEPQADLPLDPETGAVDEAALEESGTILGEVEDVDAGSSKENTFTFEDPGTYSLICNIVEEEEDGELESHYDNGMAAEITVTD